MPTTKQAKRLWWAEFMLAIVLIGGVLFCVSYTNRVDERSRRDMERESRQNDQRWCDLLRTLNEAYTSPGAKPTTELGRRIAQAVQDLNKDFAC